MGRRVKITHVKAALLIPIIFLLFGSCSSTLLDWVKSTTQKVGHYGKYSDGTKWIAFCEKEGVRIDLPGNSKDLTHNAHAGGPHFYGDTMYLPGTYYDGIRQIACYWTIKGGTATRTDLAGGPGWTMTDFEGAYFYNGTQYISGAWTDSAGNWTPCYWAGTSRVDLIPTTMSFMSDAGAIWVDSSGVTLSGWYYNGTGEVPCYWPSSTAAPVALPVPNVGTFNWAVGLWGLWPSSGTVYVTGSYYNNATTLTVPCYWTITSGLTTRTELAVDGTHSAWAWASDFSTGTLYSDGMRDDGTKYIPCYWVGTTRFDLPGSSGDHTHGGQTNWFTWLPDRLLVDGTCYDGNKEVIRTWTIQGNSITSVDYSSDGVHDTSGGIFMY